MKMKTLPVLLALVLQTGAHAADYKSGNSAFINYDWMNKIINKTETPKGACPVLEVDTYKGGFKLALEKSFYGSIGASASKWFPANTQWASVGVSPVLNTFGILFTEVENEDQISEAKKKNLPKTAEELESWNVSDAAYWESQGGVSLYVGTGIDPVNVGVFAVVTGGWTNYLQKTGNNKVYVERAKKNIKSISFGAGISYPNISLEKVAEAASGSSFEFVLDSNEAVEAFERYMAGDTTKADELSKFSDRGVLKIANNSQRKLTNARSFGVATPFVPVLSFKASVEKSYDRTEENTVWDEDTIKDTGIYTKQRNTRIFNKHFKLSRSFMGGRTFVDVPAKEGRKIEEKVYGNLKYSYMSDWGQERRLRKYISKAKALTGLAEETCTRVPSLENSLGFNQVVLEVNMSDEYMRQIMNSQKSGSKLLDKIKASALAYQSNKALGDICENQDDDEVQDANDTCVNNTPAKIEAIFSKINEHASKMESTFATDKKEFAKNVAKLGEQIWKSPFVFKAFFEKGKACGQEFKFEVSGKRISRHVVDQKWIASDACTK